MLISYEDPLNLFETCDACLTLVHALAELAPRRLVFSWVVSEVVPVCSCVCVCSKYIKTGTMNTYSILTAIFTFRCLCNFGTREIELGLTSENLDSECAAPSHGRKTSVGTSVSTAS